MLHPFAVGTGGKANRMVMFKVLSSAPPRSGDCPLARAQRGPHEGGHALTFPHPAADERGSTMDRHAGRLVHVHPGAPVRAGWYRKPSLPFRPRMKNLHSFDS